MKNGIMLTVLLVSVVLLGVASTRLTTQQQDPPGTLRIQQPQDWVPFTARVIMKNLHHETTGWFYRRSDGSTAMVLDTDVGKVITIHNVATKSTYTHRGEDGWAVHPISESALMPPKRELVLHRANYRVLDQKVADREVYEIAANNGDVSSISPGLNGLILTFRRKNGVSDEYTDITLGAPPDDVFTPPADAPVRKNDWELGKKPVAKQPAPQ
jgi:hypothetical protein